MAKLFSTEDHNYSGDSDVLAGITDQDDVDTTATLPSDSELSLDNIDRSFETLELTYQLQSSMESLDYSSKSSLPLIDINLKLFKVIQRRISTTERLLLPSLEDFNNRYSVNSSKQIALESFSTFIASVWKAIKEFFIDFYKTLKLFMKRLFGMTLNNAEIKNYIKHALDNIRVNNLNLPIDNFTAISTKLPSMLAKVSDHKYTVNDLMVDGFNKINSHITYLDSLKGVYKVIADEVNKSFNGLKGIIEDQVKTDLVALDAHKQEINETIAMVSQNAEQGQNSYNLAFESGPTTTIESTKKILVDLATFSIKQKEVLIQHLRLTPLINTAVPSQFLNAIENIDVKLMKSAVLDEYYSLGNSESLISNFNIYMHVVSGEEYVDQNKTSGDDAKTFQQMIIKLASGATLNPTVPRALTAVSDYSKLVELFEKAKVLEVYNAKESMEFVDRIGSTIDKNIKDLSSILNVEKLAKVKKEIDVGISSLSNATTIKDKLDVITKSSKERLDNYKTISNQLSKYNLRLLLNLSSELAAKITAINAEVTRELYQYIYKCTKEYRSL